MILGPCTKGEASVVEAYRVVEVAVVACIRVGDEGTIKALAEATRRAYPNIFMIVVFFLLEGV